MLKEAIPQSLADLLAIVYRDGYVSFAEVVEMLLPSRTQLQEWVLDRVGSDSPLKSCCRFLLSVSIPDMLCVDE